MTTATRCRRAETNEHSRKCACVKYQTQRGNGGPLTSVGNRSVHARNNCVCCVPRRIVVVAVVMDCSGLALTAVPHVDDGEVELDLSCNLLAVIPHMHGLPLSLHDLSLSDNLLDALPSSFAQLVALRRIRLSKNRFTVFPSVLGRMRALESISLFRNLIVALPAVEAFDNRDTITWLDLCNVHTPSTHCVRVEHRSLTVTRS